VVLALVTALVECGCADFWTGVGVLTGSVNVEVPAPGVRRIYDGPIATVVPVHEHGRGCGHVDVWYDGHETYLEGGSWVFYSPCRASWMRYLDPPKVLAGELERRRKRGEPVTRQMHLSPGSHVLT
jgi:hypothetical protein